MAVRRKREEIEDRLVSEWVSSVYPNAIVHMRCWLGALPESASDLEATGISPRIYEVVGKWADAIAILPMGVAIIEGKLKANATALGQLLLYNHLFGQTEKFELYWSQPRQLICVYAFPDHQVLELMERHGIDARRYCPDWAEQAYLTRMRRTY